MATHETHETKKARPRAMLVAVQRPGISDAALAASLAELTRLLDTLGCEVVGKVIQRRGRLEPSAVLGSGKLKELAAFTGGTGIVPKGPVKKPQAKDLRDAEEEEPEEEPVLDFEPPPAPIADMVAVDHELSPSQMRNLEGAAGVTVRDRTGIIIDIFHRHAKSREARLQVEIARLIYQAPRLREANAGTERQKGGVGQKGAGESDLELDRRKIRDRISELRQELALIEGDQKTRRQRRLDANRVALVGYTNAGKSSMMRALTGSEVYVADRLFATLDTTVRVLYPESIPKVLVADTVGFIQALPHDLVASFRSTLDEAHEAGLLLQVVDAADPDFRNQLKVTSEVLAEIEAAEIPRWIVLNKIDRVDEAGRDALRAEFPDAVQTSALDPALVRDLRDRIVGFFAKDHEDGELLVPYAKSALMGEIRAKLAVLSQEFADDGVRYAVRGPAADLAKIRARIAADDAADPTSPPRRA